MVDRRYLETSGASREGLALAKAVVYEDNRYCRIRQPAVRNLRWRNALGEKTHGTAQSTA
jgi:hypothetical protein